MPELETCANCDRKIGRLETLHLWKEQVVCPQCFALIQSAPAPSLPRVVPPAPSVDSDYATPVQNQAVARAGTVRCPACGSMVVAKKVDKSSILIAILLLLLWVLPGILYIIFCAGKVYECPRCGAKIADA